VPVYYTVRTAVRRITTDLFVFELNQQFTLYDANSVAVMRHVLAY
jgi:hypothetical protein